MPLTFLSHQAPILPLKIAAPRWFDGTALVIGSMAPDLVFALHGTDWYVDAHTITAQFWFCLPLTLVLTWVVKRVIAGPLAAHLPNLGAFHLKDYGRLSAWRPPRDVVGWLVLIASALLGSFSHLALDSFTHGFGWVVQNVAALQAIAFVLPATLSGRPVYVHDLLQVVGTVIGAAVTIRCLHVIGQRHLIRAWCPATQPLEPTPKSRRVLIGCSAVGTACGLAIAGLTLHVGGAQDLIIRVADISIIGITVGCWSCLRGETRSVLPPDPAHPTLGRDVGVTDDPKV